MPSTVVVPRFLGLRNTAQQRKQPLGSLSVAQDIDVDDEGVIVSRSGYTKTLTGTSITAAFSPMHHQYAFVVDDGRLKKVFPGESIIDIGEASREKTVWTEAGEFVFLSTGKIVVGDTLLDWRIRPPAMPMCRVIGGDLPAGQYQVVVTQTSVDGRESVSSNVTVLNVPENSGIQIDNATGKRVYLTEANGEVFYFAGESISHVTSTQFLSIPIDNAFMLKECLPEGIEQIAYYSGCVYCSLFDQQNNVTVIYWSLPYIWHSFDMQRDFIAVPGKVRSMCATGNEQDKSLIIATDKQIFAFNGDSITELAPYGVPNGDVMARTQSGVLMMWTNKGVCVAEPFQNLTMDKTALATGAFDNAFCVAKNGMETFVVLTDGSGVAENITNL